MLNIGGAMDHVLRDDGVLWVMLDDAIALPPANYAIQTYQSSRNAAKIATQTGFRTQDSTYCVPRAIGCCCRLSTTMAMQDAGWVLRDVIIIDKGARAARSRRKRGRDIRMNTPLCSQKTTTTTIMIRTRCVSPSRNRSRRRLHRGHLQEARWIRGDHLDFRANSNPMGRVMDAVWRLRPNYVGSHSAAFPEEFPHRALLLTCPPGGHVLDPLVGSGTGRCGRVEAWHEVHGH